jgi:voltage-gated potassium channel
VLDVEVDEILVRAESPLVGKSIAQAQTRKGRLLVVALKQSAGTMLFNPGAEVIAGAGDTIILLGKRADIDDFRAEYKL